MEKKKYPIGAEHYTLYEEVGAGVSASVHRALCTPLNEVVAVKILDFERDNCDLAGNVLIDARGGIKLGDFGVSACLFDSGDRQRMRNTFVGTPCWMAPEVMEQLHGYDFKADIWSFGITALELAHGHAPFSKYPPMKVLLMTLQNAPPGLDYERDRKFSKSFKQMIASCLVKDPSKRPSAKKLLKHSFFKQARSNDYIARTLLEGLPALGDRIKALKRKEEDMLAQKKMPDGQKEEISQNEYKRGISGWNFNLEDVKAQASLIQDVDDPLTDSNRGSTNSLSALDVPEKQLQFQDSFQVAELEDNDVIQNQPMLSPLVEATINEVKVKCEKSDDDSSIASSCHEQQVSQNSSPRHDDLAESKGESDKLQNLSQNTTNCTAATVMQAADDVLSEVPSKSSKSSANSDEFDEKAKAPVVQQRGRFKVTSENVDLEKVAPSPILQKSHSMQVITPHPAIPLPSTLPSPLPPPLPSPCDASSLNLSGYYLFPALNTVLQTNIVQRESILSLMKQVAGGDTTANRAVDRGGMPAQIAALEKSLLEASHDREKELLHEITELQWRLICAQDELQKIKTENAQV
ncbi:hypothetical protein ACB094_05G201900 [Castanea mollissima]